ncbi:hypothetical protein BDW22DRAFT_1354625 [Trametopsis cervina]|nr:hypothetical protein BDW22DRAFT_1354625 [Trametopsis cervina]
MTLVLPVVCVAEPHAIISILSSAVCQRRVWDVDLPVVGLEVAKYNSVARVWLAWNDEADMERIHIMRAQTSIDAGDGIFDMTDTKSAVALGLFLISLRYQFLALKSIIPSKQPRYLPWRADSIILDGETQQDRIEGWLSGTTDDGSAISAGDLQVISPQSHKACKQLQTLQSMYAPHSRSSAVDVMTSGGSELSKESSRLSASAFAQRLPGSIAEEATISSWMLSRAAVSVSAVPLPDGNRSVHRDFVNRMNNEYDATTEFVWPASWKDKHDVPSVAEPLDVYRTEFIDHHWTISDKSWARKPLDEGLVPAIEGKLSRVFNAVQSARSKGSLALNETEAQRVWNELIHDIIDKNVSGATSSKLLLQPDIMFSSNPLLRSLSTDHWDSTLEGLYGMLDDWELQCSAVYEVSRDPDSSLSVLEEQSRQALSAATRTQEAFEELETSGRIEHVLTEQAGQEPVGGTADAALCVTVDFAPSKFQSRTGRPFQLIVHSGPSEFDHVKAEEAGNLSNAPTNEPDTTTTASLLDNRIITPPAHQHEDPTTANLNSTLPPPRGVSSSNKFLLLPALLVDYKKPWDSDGLRALNECRMHCISSVHFLSAIGIRQWPVYGFLTTGTKGCILMASMSDEGMVHMFDRNVRTFELSNVLQVYSFAAFLLRLRVKNARLRGLFEEKRSALEERLRSGVLDHWATELQRK